MMRHLFGVWARLSARATLPLLHRELRVLLKQPIACRRTVSMLLGVIALASCYETEFPLLEKGERVALAGAFQCVNAIDGSNKNFVFTEEREGIVFANYRYNDPNGSPTLAKKLPNGLYLAQSTLAKGRFGYAYIDFQDQNNYFVLVPDMLTKSGYIEALFKKFGVNAKSVGESIVLKGEKKAVLDFLSTHDKGLLMMVLKCSKTESGSRGTSPVPSPSTSVPEQPRAGAAGSSASKSLFASVEGLFEAWFNSSFYRETIFFSRSQDIWEIDPDGANPKRILAAETLNVERLFDRNEQNPNQRMTKKVAYLDKSLRCHAFDLITRRISTPKQDGDCRESSASPDGKLLAAVIVTDKFGQGAVDDVRRTDLKNYGISATLKEGAAKTTKVVIYDIGTGAVVRQIEQLVNPAPDGRPTANSWNDSDLFWKSDSTALYFLRDFSPGIERLEGSGVLGTGFQLSLKNGQISSVDHGGAQMVAWQSNLIVFEREGGATLLNTSTAKSKSSPSTLHFHDLRYTMLLALVGDTCELAVFDDNGEKLRNIMRCSRRDNITVLSGRISPSAEQVAYFTSCEVVPRCRAEPRLWVAPLTSKEKPKPITVLGGVPVPDNPKSWFKGSIEGWSPDGKFLLYVTGDSSAWIISSDGANKRKLGDGISAASWARVPTVSVVSPETARVIVLLGVATGLAVLFAILVATSRSILRSTRTTVLARQPSLSKVPLSPSQVIYCSQCGTRQSTSQSYCTECGTPLEKPV